jgi:hypothetical protein
VLKAMLRTDQCVLPMYPVVPYPVGLLRFHWHPTLPSLPYKPRCLVLAADDYRNISRLSTYCAPSPPIASEPEAFCVNLNCSVHFRSCFEALLGRIKLFRYLAAGEHSVFKVL